ncbi:fructose-bisphosphate aldolase [Microthyrium microscopicum]|uniref:Fructose-bisphosphate aldolase n=1 Tax=Microthyrium microscopicum TaxID=703497 RepID=A0A6A6U3H6_9PEZI|nr:fructose-bisphosphate aldolase [Microthyrium microscopicum]
MASPIAFKPLSENKTLQILSAAEQGHYAVVSPVIYNLEHIIGSIRAAEAKRAPLIIEMFPWAITFSSGLLVHCAAQAAKQATIPVSVHLDHAQDEEQIRYAADNLPFDSIMIDMSHHEREENLRKTKELTEYCHERGIAVEAEPGRIEGGEDGIADTAELEGVLTTEKDVEDFAAAGVDVLAPAIGNVHGSYGARGPQFDLKRLQNIQSSIAGRMRIALHGTTGVPDELLRQCIAKGVTKVNVNK